MTVVTDLPSLARYILSPQCQSIGFLTGAGVSVASGIPDFRSPGGMYDTLRPDLITATPLERHLMERDPTHVVSWSLFCHNSLPYMEVRRPFILGTQQHKWKATIFHRFVELLQRKLPAKFTRLYTQNIDGLDHQVHIPEAKIVNVHGSLSQVACEGCGTAVALDVFCDAVRANIKDIYGQDHNAPAVSTPITCSACQQALVKPTTVLFGRNLPARFGECLESDAARLDLLVVAGTSLVVYPANMLVPSVPTSCKRVVVNRERVGEELGLQFDGKVALSLDHDDEGRNDLFLPGDCDDSFAQLAIELGWKNDLLAIQHELPEASQLTLQNLIR